MRQPEIGDVLLLDSIFRDAQCAALSYLLALDVDRLLTPYIREAGLEPATASYPGWEQDGLDGHTAGHALSGLARLGAATGDPRMRERAAHMVTVLHRCQDAGSDGYIGGTPGGRQAWTDVSAGRIQAGAFELNGKWVPLYNLDKLLTGLLDVADLMGNSEALIVAERLARWWLRITAELTTAQFGLILRTEYGAFARGLVELTARTGDPVFLKAAARFTDDPVLIELAAGRASVLDGLHANTQIPKIIGAARLLSVSHDIAMDEIVETFWADVVDNRSTPIGGHGESEHFHPSSDFTGALESRQGPETCNTYNMIRLAALRSGGIDDAAIDFVERGLLNHLVTSVETTVPGFAYFTPLRPDHYRVVSDVETSFWCCVGTGLEAHAEYGRWICRVDAEERRIEIDMYIASRILAWPGLVLELNTQWPRSDVARLVVRVDSPQMATICLRLPHWSSGAYVDAGTRPVHADTSTRRARITGMWSDGDAIVVRLPADLRAERLGDGSDWVSLFHGAAVLVGIGEPIHATELVADSSRMSHVARGALTPLAATPILDEGRLEPEFHGGGAEIVAADGRNVRLLPFYQVGQRRYTLCFPITRGDVAARRAELAEIDAIAAGDEARTIDLVRPGEQQSEVEHDAHIAQSELGYSDEQRWRETDRELSYAVSDFDGTGEILRIRIAPAHDTDRHAVVAVSDIVIGEIQSRPGDATRTFDLPVRMSSLVEGTGSTARVTIRCQGAASSPRLSEIRLLRGVNPS